MDKDQKKKRFKPQVFYPGGNKAMSKFVDDNLRYPEEAATKKVKGTVRIRLTINYKGKVTKSKILSSLG